MTAITPTCQPSDDDERIRNRFRVYTGYTGFSSVAGPLSSRPQDTITSFEELSWTSIPTSSKPPGVQYINCFAWYVSKDSPSSTPLTPADIYLNPSVGKAQIYRHTQFDVHTNVFGELDRERHRQKRKIYGNVLSERSLRAFEPCMAREVDMFLGQLMQSAAQAVNVSPLCRHLTTDVAGQLAFGQPLKTQTEETNRIFPRAMVSMNAIVNIFMSWPILKKAWPLLRRFNKKNGLAFSQAIRGIINKRKALPKDARHDFFSLVPTDADSLDEGLKSTELWAEAIFFLPAGRNPTGGTTLAAALSAVFFYLSRHPGAYATLAAEIRTCFASGRDIKAGPRLAGCAYLRATLDETLRVAPPFTGTFWREPFPDHGAPFVVDGRTVPRGTVVGVNPYCVMHNEEYFPEPFSFRPERWLGSGDDEKAMRAAFAPFAFGETGCLGKAMAYHEMSLVVAKTLWYFDFERALGEAGDLGGGRPGDLDGRHRVDEYQLFDHAVANHDGPNLVFTPRGDYYRSDIEQALGSLET
ncbi:hypothetical protein KJ359_005327 [Pestalotiopsis sp. 9143b]|nr:hypothetical protein KJ359_005327 [Pestalotiopsis sp. 9143b]